MRTSKKTRNLLEDLDFLRELAQRSIVCPPNFMTQQQVDNAYKSLRGYLEEEKPKKI
jgi:hypothetical protein